MSHPGKVREANQDQYLIASLQKSMQVASSTLSFEADTLGRNQGELLLVADGMGGHAAGDRASRLAIRQLIQGFLDRGDLLSLAPDRSVDALTREMQAMLLEVHRRILEVSSMDPEQRGMGTTLTMAMVVGSTLDVAHIGDSRCYLVRQGVAEQLTKDHTLARQMVDSGGMTPEEEAGSRWSSVLWNVLGGHGEGGLTVELRRIPLEPGDTLVLCTDGLYRYVDARHLAAIVDASDSPESACRRLVAVANEAGGEDNITVVVSGTQEEITPEAIDEADTEVP